METREGILMESENELRNEKGRVLLEYQEAKQESAKVNGKIGNLFSDIHSLDFKQNHSGGLSPEEICDFDQHCSKLTQLLCGQRAATKRAILARAQAVAIFGDSVEGWGERRAAEERELAMASW
jgi:hypothetical protein